MGCLIVLFPANCPRGFNAIDDGGLALPGVRSLFAFDPLFSGDAVLKIGRHVSKPGQSSSRTIAKTSTSRVMRGSPSKDAASPPMRMPRMDSDRHHAMRSGKGPMGSSSFAFFGTVRFPQLRPTCPNSRNFFYSFGIVRPTELPAHGEKRPELSPLGFNRRGAQFLLLAGIDELPTAEVRTGFGFGHVVGHILLTIPGRPRDRPGP